MSNNIFKESLDAVVKELTETITERDDLENRLDEMNYRIEKLQEAVRGLSALCNIDYQAEYPALFPPSPGIGQGFTDKIRNIFLTNLNKRFSAIDVRNNLRETGFPIDRYSNGLATIHTVLRRLLKSDVVRAEDRDGKTYYYMLADDIPF